MHIQQPHSFSVDLTTAKSIQVKLAKKIIHQPLKKNVRIIAGADVAYMNEKHLSLGAVTVMEFPALEIIEQTYAVTEITFPYVPGFLTFREAPVLLQAFKLLKTIPDVIIFDGQGIAHRNKMGIAAHIGVILDLPTIGCAKKRLIGEYENPVLKKGNFSPLLYKNEQIGAVLCTKDGTKPVFVSPGQKMTIEDSVEWVLRCCTKYRLPEPVRKSHNFVNQLKNKL